MTSQPLKAFSVRVSFCFQSIMSIIFRLGTLNNMRVVGKNENKETKCSYIDQRSEGSFSHHLTQSISALFLKSSIARNSYRAWIVLLAVM